MNELAVSIPAEIVPRARKTVSHSEVEAYLKCERAHYYGYGMQIQHKYTSDALSRGTLGHKALEVYFTARMNGTPYDDCVSESIGFISSHMATHMEDLTICSELLVCLTIFFNQGGMQEFEILAVEKEFVLSVTDDLEMPFIPDVIVRDSSGRIGVVDNKFIKTLYSDRDLAHMPQLAKYAGALRVMGYDIEWAALSEFKWSAMTADPVTKYKFQYLELNDARIKRSFKEQVIASTRIQERKTLSLYEWGEDALRASNTMICGNCSFRAICDAELNDYQPQLILDNEYVAKTRREFGGSTNGQ